LKAQKTRTFFGFAFPIMLSIFLYWDSDYFSTHYFNGRLMLNFIIVSYFLWMLTVADLKLKKLMIGMVLLSIFGEQLFCNWLNMYDYRDNTIPFYVPFGHAIVLASAYMLYQVTSKFNTKRNTEKIAPFFFGLIFSVAILFFGDYLTLILGILFFHSLIRKKWSPFYCYLALYVLTIEYIGTYFGIWTWKPKAFGYIPTLSPPVAIAYAYVGATSLLTRILKFLEQKKLLPV